MSLLKSKSSVRNVKLGDRKGSFTGELDLLLFSASYRRGVLPRLDAALKIGSFLPLDWSYSGNFAKSTSSPDDIFTREEVEENSDSNSIKKDKDSYTIPYSFGGDLRLSLMPSTFESTKYNLISGLGVYRSSGAFRREGNWFTVESYDIVFPVSMSYRINSHFSSYSTFNLSKRLSYALPGEGDVGILMSSLPLFITVGLSISHPYKILVHYTFSYFENELDFQNIKFESYTIQNILGFQVKI